MRCATLSGVSPSLRSARVAGFLVAEAVSAIGSFATMVAIWGYAAYEFDATPGQVALFGLAFSVPGVLLGPVTGTVVDRLGPKPTLAVSKVIGVVASLLLLGAHSFTAMALLSALHGVAGSFAHPALQSMPPRLVDERHLARTNALVSLSDEFALVLGPAAAGIAIGLVGFHGAFVFDALTYAVGLAVLPLVRLRPRAAASGGEPPVRWRDALEGWRLVARRPVLGRVVACTAAVHLLYGIALLAEPLYVRDVLHRSEAVFASLQTVFGVFLVAGGILAARAGERIASFRFVALGVAASGAAAVVYLGTPSVVVAFSGVALWGVATASISGPARTVMQRATPEHAHGRVMAADMLAANAAMLAGTAVAGPLVEAAGVPWAVAGFGAVAAVVGTATFLADRRGAPAPDPAVALDAA